MNFPLTVGILKITFCRIIMSISICPRILVILLIPTIYFSNK